MMLLTRVLKLEVFRLRDGRAPEGRDKVYLEARDTPDDVKWAITSKLGSALNHDGEWEFEPFGLQLRDEFIARTTWDSEEDALKFLQEREDARGAAEK